MAPGSTDTLERLSAAVCEWLDPGTCAPLADQGLGASTGVASFAGSVGGRPVLVAGVDPTSARGALGTEEAAALRRVFEAARERSIPLVLWLDSAGARLDQGLQALAAFRPLYRAALSARAAGVPMVALVGSVCFGGASMLACLAHRRIYAQDSLLGMSGPAIVAALDAAAHLDPRDRAATAALFGAAVRCEQDAGASSVLAAPDATPAAVRDALAGLAGHVPWNFEADHRALLARLEKAGLEVPRSPRPPDPALKRRLDALFEGGFETLLGDGVLRGVRVRDGREVSVTGLVGGAPLTALSAWMVAESISTAVKARPDRPVAVFYDSPGHAPTRADEALTLSAYVAHLAEAVAWAGSRGVPVTLWILGEASGGGYVALAAAARRVYALPGADIRVLPRAAVARVLAKALPDAAPDPAGWVGMGIAEEVLGCDRWPDDAGPFWSVPPPPGEGG